VEKPETCLPYALSAFARQQESPKTVLAQAGVEEARRLRMRELIYEQPTPSIGPPISIYIEDAITYLTDHSKSKVVRDRVRRDIVRDIEAGKIRLNKADSYAKKKRPKNKQVRAAARQLALNHWQKHRRMTITRVATDIMRDPVLHNYAVTTIEEWIADLHPKHFK
jgi:hypothetical protein